MAINKITQPGTIVPIGNDDYTQQNLLINAVMSQSNEILTDWKSTAAIPDIKQGTYIYHSGNMYSVDGSNENISGSPATGINYVALTASGTILTAAWITSLSGYTWNPVYNGLYNGNILIIKACIYVSGISYQRGIILDNAISGGVLLADGHILVNALTSENIAINGNLSVSGEANIGSVLTCNKINTGPGETEVYGMDQPVKHNSNVRFNSIRTDNTYLKQKILSIGTWNMDANYYTSIAHGLSQSKIRSVTAIVRNDTTLNYRFGPLEGTKYNGTLGGRCYALGSTIWLERVTGGLFDTTEYDSTTINRGYVLITYVE